ncbi:arginase family protein [Pseudomonas sp. NMI760_13]|uniref:arginase family protein n=1 Tax=Pseudomonas sp. NMI760_13 TaxID=2903147 RepID=UPI002AA48E60|nr:arginase family protein [Mitsuaria sp. RG]
MAKALATHWPGVPAPLFDDTYVVQLGERENRDEDFAWPDINHTSINRIDVFEALAIGPEAVVRRIGDVLDQAPAQGFWIHLDVDVLDQATMPAVDSPGTPGLTPDDLVKIMTPFVADRRCRGMTVTVFDPDLDPDGRFAAVIVGILARLPFPNGAD